MVLSGQNKLLPYFIPTAQPKYIKDESIGSLPNLRAKIDPASLFTTTDDNWHLVSTTSRKANVMKEYSAPPLCLSQYGVLSLVFDSLPVDSLLPKTIVPKKKLVQFKSAFLPVTTIHTITTTVLDDDIDELYEDSTTSQTREEHDLTSKDIDDVRGDFK